MSQGKAGTERWAAARVAANAAAHGVSGSAEYDDEVRARAVYSAEAGLSFFHTHAEGLGLILFFVGIGFCVLWFFEERDPTQRPGSPPPGSVPPGGA